MEEGSGREGSREIKTRHFPITTVLRLKLEVVDTQLYRHRTIMNVGGYEFPRLYKVKEGEFSEAQKRDYIKELTQTETYGDNMMENITKWAMHLPERMKEAGKTFERANKV